MEDDRKPEQRPWARTFDLILREYPAYDDEKILDLRLDRIVQMVEVIIERRTEEREAEQRIRLVESELATKYLVMGMSVAAQSKPGIKWLQKFVKQMNFVKALRLDSESDPEQQEEELPSTSSVMAAFGAGPDGQVGKRSE